jgi:hypothetical protein
MSGTVEMMRTVVILRDGGCIASRIDPEAGPCFDAWGKPLGSKWDVEIDYIAPGAHGPHHVLARDHVSLCAGHHRGTGPQGGRVWSRQEGMRARLRAHLDGMDSLGRSTGMGD